MTIEEIKAAIQEAVEKYPVVGIAFINEEYGGEWSAVSDRDMSLEDIEELSEIFEKAEEYGMEESMKELIEISYTQHVKMGTPVIGEEDEEEL